MRNWPPVRAASNAFLNLPSDMDTKPHVSVNRISWHNGTAVEGTRHVPQETAIALSYGGSTHAVMMGTPADLEDFAYGFTLNEGVATKAEDILSVETVYVEGGIDLHIELAEPLGKSLSQRRRAMAGPVGCGLCGVESIAAAMRALPVVGEGLLLNPSDIADAMQALSSRQPIHVMTHAVHAAGFHVPGEGMLVVREDVGRHNALDKLCGALARAGTDGNNGMVVVTSRVSLEMVQKTATIGCQAIAAVSAPTALAIEAAKNAGMTLVALARGRDFEIFSHAQRITTGARANVA